MLEPRRLFAGGAATLVLDGTAASDSMTVGIIDDQIVVTLGTESTQHDASFFADILINGLAGDDTINVFNLDKPVSYVAASGSDTINVIDGTLTLASDLGAGGAVVNMGVDAGANVVFTGPQHIESLTLLGSAMVSLAAEVGQGFVVVVDQLDLSPVSIFDVGAGAAVITQGDIGTSNGSGYSGLTGRVAAGHSGGTWVGPGITSRLAIDNGGLTGVGIARAGDILALEDDASTGTWRGQTVTGGSVLLAYTYVGDANLDGLVSGDDYSTIDFSIAMPGAGGYLAGDFNFDGIISGDDYSVIDFNIAAQGEPLGW